MATKTKSKGKAKRKGAAKDKTKSGGMPAAERGALAEQKFAFPKERKEPLNDAAHVRNAVARFDQVKGVGASKKDAAWRRIKRAAKKFDVDISEKSWRELGSGSTKKGSKAKSTKK